MNFRDGNWRARNQVHQIAIPFSTMYSITNYSTDAKEKMDIKTSEVFSDEFQRLNHMPDPLRKNLADTVITQQVRSITQTKMAQEFGLVNKTMSPVNTDASDRSVNRESFASGITNFISSMFNVLSGAVFQRRSEDFYDCYDDARQRSPPLAWQTSKISELNKNQRDRSDADAPPEMTTECKYAADNCEQKLQNVRLILSSNATGSDKPKCRVRRPKKAFVEAGTVEEKFEDAIEPEDLGCIPDASHVDCVGYFNHQSQELFEIDAPIMKTETEPTKTVPDKEDVPVSNDFKDIKEEIDFPNEVPKEMVSDVTNQSIKQEVVASCEDKVNKLKALLQQRRKHNAKTNLSNSNSTEDTINKQPHQNVHDKHYKNPNRLSCDKRKKSKLRRNIEDDMLFANEIADDNIVDTPSIRITEHPKSSEDEDGFNEVSGRFRSVSATESEDSFQIVFADVPKTSKIRTISDCDSEDSFIVFEDSPDSCFTSNDVFGDDTESVTDDTDSESDVSDSGCGISKLAHQFSRTISDLTDDNLYEGPSEDHVDCAVRTVAEEVKEPIMEEPVKSTSLLLDAKKKMLRKNQPPKKVRFSTDPPKVRVMRVWAFAARQARPGHWERHALDRERFKRRIADVDVAVSWVLKPQHRSRVMFQRFMPWWNQLKRQEIADKKKREAEEKIKQEQEAKRKAEEELHQKEEEEKRRAEEAERKTMEEEELRKKEEDRLREEAELKKLSYNNFNGFKLNGNVEAKDWSKCRQTPTKLVQKLALARESGAKKASNDKNATSSVKK